MQVAVQTFSRCLADSVNTLDIICAGIFQLLHGMVLSGYELSTFCTKETDAQAKEQFCQSAFLALFYCCNQVSGTLFSHPFNLFKLILSKPVEITGIRNKPVCQKAIDH
ncbi:unknown [Dialister sp. CAG:357]|nr:unknown [Dialister sp. CAG:357]